ncbi:MAG TPA: hypothetical protein VGG31_08385 [Candidatus Dormibacteraeota bacterium]
MKRLLYAFAALAALLPLSASAASPTPPTPSPSLDTILVAAPSGFTELTSSPFHGQFTAHDYATNVGAAKAAEMESTLNSDGFVDGYGKTYIQQSAGHALIQAVIAFTGGKGAHDWLTQAEAGDKADTTYKHSDTISGIDSYYGVHFADASNNTTGDGFSFVKGNDVFLIDAVSQKDDVLTLATSQTMAQFNKAPSETIPSSKWPENKNPVSSAASSLGGVIGDVLIGIVVLGVLAVLGGLIARSRRRTPALAGYGQMPMAAAASAAPAGVQMSEDGRFWWDGQSWKDAEHEAPPSAQRSSDGSLWWDGTNWRPVPQQPPG